ncbi:MAG TPA: SH3 domain-containing protein [Longimicrobiaceae bacterium]|nr:SH3 domain-containing protein [Longimicrobiaceae bacterium]
MAETLAPPIPALAVVGAPPYRVDADGLNLRSAPEVRRDTRLAVLTRGQSVFRTEISPDGAWWRVEAAVGGRRVEGWVAARYLAPDAAFTPAPAHRGIRAVHLAEGRASVTRESTGSAYAYPLGEPGQPRRDPARPTAERIASLGAIIDWLAVERSRRYRPHGGVTYCNVYAADYCYLASAYLPRVWWMGRALERLARGEPVTPGYDATVQEMTANRLYGWLCDYGADFGWRRTFSTDELQAGANEGEVGIVCAQRRDLNRSGHIVAVVPETEEHGAVREGGRVRVPLQSQAGVTNHRYCSKLWWGSARFRAFGFWLHG